MGQALYRKYRSRSLAELVGQEHIVTTLNNALKSGAISHAYLLTGPRGVGKTSVARILAHQVNGLEYDEQATHLDIIEIDAASNRRIDEIRDLRDKVHIAPTSTKYKVYIIDEVHMLTREAFNALLKTLEEPPAHAIFILATTEVHKLPETIISRTQRFTFKPIEPAQAVGHLRQIAASEHIQVSDEALALIAQHSDGSFRDSIGLLDQISSLGRTIEASDVLAMLGIAPAQAISQLKTILFGGTPKQIADALTALRDQGYQAAHLAHQLSDQLRQDVLDGTGDRAANLQLLGQLLEVPAASSPDMFLEITLLNFNLTHSSEPQPIATPSAAVAPTPSKPPAAPVSKKPAATPKKPAPAPPAAPASTPKNQIAQSLEQAWPQILTTIKQKNNTLYGVLRMAEPTLEDDKLTLAFQFQFHQKRIEDSKNKQIITQLAHDLLGKPITVRCIVQKNAQPPVISDLPAIALEEAPVAVASNPLATITNIFGGAEVLE